MYSETEYVIRALAENAESVCRAYLPAGRREGSYWIVGDLQNNPGRSLFVRLTGPASGPGAAGKFTDGNPLLGQPASLDPAAWANSVTDELLNVIQAGGLVPAEGNHAQLLAAITALARGVLPKRSFTAGDFIRIPDVPGGLIIQWGTMSFSAGVVSVTFAQAFPTHVFVVVPGDASAAGNLAYIGADAPTLSGFTGRSSNASDTGAARYITIGY